MSETDELSSIDLVRSKSDDYRVHAANGAVGGLQYKGNFQIDFIQDKIVGPELETYDIEENRLGDLLGTTGETHIERELQVGVSMNQRQAYNIATWILSELLVDVTEEDIKETLMEAYPDRFE